MLHPNRLITILVLVALILSACQPIQATAPNGPVASTATTTESERASQVTGAFEAAFNEGLLDGLEAVFDPAVVIHVVQRPEMTGIQAYREYVADLHDAFPDAHLTFDEMKLSGDVSFARYTFTGTHTAPSIAFGPPTGKAVSITGEAIAHYVNGKIVEMWEYGDNLGMQMQLGYTLTPPADIQPVRKAMAMVNDISMYYEIHGSGPPLLLIHGGTASGAESWAAQIPLLARSFKLIVPDARGHGRTTDSDQPISYVLMADDYIKLLDKLGIQQSYVLGWSDGAIVGLYLVQQHPERVLGYVGMEPNLTVDGLVPGFLELAKTLTPETFPPEWTHSFYLDIAPDPAHFPEFIKKMGQMWTTQPTFTHADFANNKVPILLLSGEKSEVVQPAHLKEWAAVIPNATLKSIPDVGHDYPGMRTEEFVADVTGFLLNSKVAPTATLDQALTSEIETTIQQIMQERLLPGLAIGIVKDGKVVYVNGFGVADVESRRPVTARTLFELGSLSKQFTAMAVMQLVEQGKIKLDDPLVNYLPYFELKDARYKEITIHQMLSHRSGLPALQIDSMLDYARSLTPEYDEGAAERMVRSLATLELQFAPGEGYGYSDIAFNVLGAVVARVSGQSFEDYVRDHIFLPLGMNDSTFELRAVNPALLARPHFTGQDGKPHKPAVFPYARSNTPSSHPYISALDMTRWLLANLNHGELDGVRILQPESHQMMWSIHAPETGMGEVIPEWASYGLGWMIGTMGGEPSVSHGGADLGYVAIDYLFPEKKIGIVIVTNRDDSFDDALGTALAFQPLIQKIAGIEQ